MSSHTLYSVDFCRIIPYSVYMEGGIVMNKNLYHPYINDKGKRINGSASLNHYIHTVKGGIQNYNDEIGAAYISEFVKSHSDIINAGLAQKAKKDNFKVV